MVQIDPLQEQLNRQWEVDFQDLSSNKPVMSRDDETALGIMQDTVKFVNGKYELTILWKIDPDTLPDNYCVAEKDSSI